MKPGWIAVFAFPVLCSSLSHPQVPSPVAVPSMSTLSDAKTASRPDVGGDSYIAPPPRRQEIADTPAALAGPPLTEEELRLRLVGRQLFLRGLWLSDTLHFDLRGALEGQSPSGSFTLCAVEIAHVRLTKRRLELEGLRYGIHFEDEASWSSQAGSFDRIRITPRKKHLEIILDRQVIIVPKKKKNGGRKEASADRTTAGSAAPLNDPAAPNADSTTTSPAESAEHLRQALDKIFAPSLDEKMIAAMPDYWQYFYRAQTDHKSIEPTDAGIYRPGPGVQAPVLLTNVAPGSNDYAQRSEVAGVASYKVILDLDGKPLAVAVFRPIGFGLDEGAVAAIRKSTFAPARKDGKPVASVIDISVNFRIYSRRTAAAVPGQNPDAPPAVTPVTGKAALPGIYTANASNP